MRGKSYLDRHGKFVLDMMRDARRLPKDLKPIFLEGMGAALKAISERRFDKVEKAIKILKGEVCHGKTRA